MQIVPLQPVPAQVVGVILNGQSCQLGIFQRNSGLYFNLYVDNVLIIGGVICENINRIVRNIYLGFIGDFVFVDNTGAGADPVYTGLGSQFVLAYLEPLDLNRADG